MKHKRLLVVQVAGLGHEFLLRQHGARWEGLSFAPMAPVLPAVTCAVQASFRTATLPAQHGMPANGFYDRRTHRVAFWEQSADLVAGERIWDGFRTRRGRVALLFWQQSLGESADQVVSPAPIHKHHGGIVDTCYSRPAGLYEALCKKVGRPFRLRHYWGPLASARSSRWIAEATAALLADRDQAPDLCLTYLPILDYDLQRFGPDGPKARTLLQEALGQLSLLKKAADDKGYEILIFGDYAITACPGGAVYPNRALRDAGLLITRTADGRDYLDCHASRAFAMVDHQVAHVYVRRPEDLQTVASVLRTLPGMDRVVTPAELEPPLDHAAAGELMALAGPEHWLAYPWWSDAARAPDYAGHIDIHNKPGYDPCELFWGWPPGRVSQRTERIAGTHGLVRAEAHAAWTSTLEFAETPRNTRHLAQLTRLWLEEK